MATETRQDTKPKSRQTIKSRRIAFRLTDELGRQLERAVAISGRSQSDLITEAISDKANEIIQRQSYLELSEGDMEALLEAIANPPPPNDAMLRSIARWREAFAPE